MARRVRRSLSALKRERAQRRRELRNLDSEIKRLQRLRLRARKPRRKAVYTRLLRNAKARAGARRKRILQNTKAITRFIARHRLSQAQTLVKPIESAEGLVRGRYWKANFNDYNYASNYRSAHRFLIKFLNDAHARKLRAVFAAHIWVRTGKVFPFKPGSKIGSSRLEIKINGKVRRVKVWVISVFHNLFKTDTVTESEIISRNLDPKRLDSWISALGIKRFLKADIVAKYEFTQPQVTHYVQR